MSTSEKIVSTFDSLCSIKIDAFKNIFELQKRFKISNKEHYVILAAYSKQRDRMILSMYHDFTQKDMLFDITPIHLSFDSIYKRINKIEKGKYIANLLDELNQDTLSFEDARNIFRREIITNNHDTIWDKEIYADIFKILVHDYGLALEKDAMIQLESITGKDAMKMNGKDNQANLFYIHLVHVPFNVLEQHVNKINEAKSNDQMEQNAMFKKQKALAIEDVQSILDEIKNEESKKNVTQSIIEAIQDYNEYTMNKRFDKLFTFIPEEGEPTYLYDMFVKIINFDVSKIDMDTLKTEDPWLFEYPKSTKKGSFSPKKRQSTLQKDSLSLSKETIQIKPAIKRFQPEQQDNSVGKRSPKVSQSFQTKPKSPSSSKKSSLTQDEEILLDILHRKKNGGVLTLADKKVLKDLIKSNQ